METEKAVKSVEVQAYSGWCPICKSTDIEVEFVGALGCLMPMMCCRSCHALIHFRYEARA